MAPPNRECVATPPYPVFAQEGLNHEGRCRAGTAAGRRRGIHRLRRLESCVTASSPAISTTSAPNVDASCYGINDCGPTDGLHTRDPCRPGNAMTVCRFRNRCCLAEAKHASHGARDTAFYVRRTGVTRRIYRPSTHSPLIDRLGDGRRTGLDIGDAGTMQGLRMSAGRVARDNQPVGPPQFLLDRVKQFRRSAVVHDWDARMRNRHV
jgi:hypothetical protein